MLRNSRGARDFCLLGAGYLSGRGFGKASEREIAERKRGGAERPVGDAPRTLRAAVPGSASTAEPDSRSCPLLREGGRGPRPPRVRVYAQHASVPKPAPTQKQNRNGNAAQCFSLPGFIDPLP